MRERLFPRICNSWGEAGDSSREPGIQSRSSLWMAGTQLLESLTSPPKALARRQTQFGINCMNKCLLYVFDTGFDPRHACEPVTLRGMAEAHNQTLRESELTGDLGLKEVIQMKVCKKLLLDSIKKMKSVLIFI